MLRVLSTGSSTEPGGDSGPARFDWESSTTPGWQRTLNVVIAFALVAGFAAQVRHYAFIGDDAFISFRYARNLVDGLGLVWNVGEAVEGYTNFLWVLIMAAGMEVGIEPERLSITLGILSGLAVLAGLVWRNAACHGWRQPLIWLAPATLVASRSFTAWSTGGLETQFFTLVVLLAFALLFLERGNGDGAPWRSSLLFAMAALIRPEGVLFATVAGGCLFVDTLANFSKRRSVGACLWFALPFLVIVGGHLLWRHSYYGYWLPNTWYAKVHGLWWDQSAKYFHHFFADYRLQLFLPFALVPAFLRRRFDDYCLLAAVCVYCAYVVYVGGDRFEFRFLVVVLPVLYMLVADGWILIWRTLGVRNSRAVRVIAALAVAVAAISMPATTLGGSRRPEAVRTRDSIASLGAIRAYAERRIDEGRRLRDAIDRGLLPVDLMVAVTGAGALPYYTMWPMVDMHGLNDATIAHQRVRVRSQIGHEQQLPPGYLAERDVVVVDVLNQLSFGTDPMRVAVHMKRAARLAKAMRVKDATVGLETPARVKCLRFSDDRVMIFVTVVTEEAFERALGHLESCGPGNVEESH
jgi:arabinofuranosyltransferase